MSIVDVAKAAGVSHTTVSRVINGHPHVSERICRRVRAAMASLGYAPPERRRGPKPGRTRGNRTGSVSLLMLGLDGTLLRAPVFATVLHHLERELSAGGLHLTLIQAAELTVVPPGLTNGGSNGFLLWGQEPGGALLALLQTVPAVWIMDRHSHWGDHVFPDKTAVGAQAARYLLDRGRRQLALLVPEPGHPASRPLREAFVRAGEDGGATVTVLESRRAPVAGPTGIRCMVEEEAIRDVVGQYLALRRRPVGVFSPSDLITAVVYRELQRAGVRPGTDVEIVSCNHEAPLLAGLDPRPPTFDLRADVIARQAVRQLLWRSAHRDEPVRVAIRVQPQLIGADGGVAVPAAPPA